MSAARQSEPQRQDAPNRHHDPRIAAVRGVAAFTAYRRMPQFFYRLHELKLKKGEDGAAKGTDPAQMKKLIIIGILAAVAFYLLSE